MHVNTLMTTVCPGSFPETTPVDAELLDVTRLSVNMASVTGSRGRVECDQEKDDHQSHVYPWYHL